MPVVLASIEDVQGYIGKELGSSEWKPITFENIKDFADATGDQQWIHVDRERAEKESPYGAPIAHGYLTLSLVAGLFFDVLDLQGFSMVINYGANKVRFPSPVKVDSRVRLRLQLASANQVKTTEWWDLIFLATIDIEDQDKPACFAEVVFRVKTQ